jgi:hypothetical protein
MPKQNKTENMTEYQKAYRAAHPKDKETINEYMKEYIKKSESVDCPHCNGHYKAYAKYKHDSSKKHIKALIEIKEKEEKALAEEKLKPKKLKINKKETTLPKNTEKLPTKAPTPAPKDTEKLSKKAPVRRPKNKEVIPTKAPTPAPKDTEKLSKKAPVRRPKDKETLLLKPLKEQDDGEEDKLKKKLKKRGTSPDRQRNAKKNSLELLKDYESSSDDEGEEETEDEDEKPQMDLKKTKFKFANKQIDAEAVAQFLREHHEESVNPARPSNSKTPRLNKNASLWRKVMKELDLKTWKYLGDNFGEIVSKAYDKPSSQADLIQMLKQVVIHFTKVSVPIQKEISYLARHLKEEHISKQK